MTTIMERKRPLKRNTKPRHDHTPASSGHDLPILALGREDPPHRPDWASLLDDGVQPALILGAERRSSGRR